MLVNQDIKCPLIYVRDSHIMKEERYYCDKGKKGRREEVREKEEKEKGNWTLQNKKNGKRTKENLHKISATKYLNKNISSGTVGLKDKIVD